eukprot:6212500-Pleurochrysis_carterae.AAC.5
MCVAALNKVVMFSCRTENIACDSTARRCKHEKCQESEHHMPQSKGGKAAQRRGAVPAATLNKDAVCAYVKHTKHRMEATHCAHVQARDVLASRGDPNVSQRAAHRGGVRRSSHAKKCSVRVQRTNHRVQRNCTARAQGVCVE